jgi:hypothetical protein
MVCDEGASRVIDEKILSNPVTNQEEVFHEYHVIKIPTLNTYFQCHALHV